jgi:putative NIF3 family GTP cyclohydrolase 1 type 2
MVVDLPLYGYRHSARGVSLFEPAIDRMAAKVPNALSLKRSILSHHTNADDAGRVAHEAGVKTLVLSHLVPLTIRKSLTRCGSIQRHSGSMAKLSSVGICSRSEFEF